MAFKYFAFPYIWGSSQYKSITSQVGWSHRCQGFWVGIHNSCWKGGGRWMVTTSVSLKMNRGCPSCRGGCREGCPWERRGWQTPPRSECQQCHTNSKALYSNNLKRQEQFCESSSWKINHLDPQLESVMPLEGTWWAPWLELDPLPLISTLTATLLQQTSYNTRS